MSDDPRAALGRAVREAREQAGLTRGQLSARTAIRTHVLEDLERGRTRSSGGRAYARGHLRAVAAATGVDPGPLLGALDRVAGRSSAPVSAPSPLPAPRTTALGVPLPAPLERRGPRWGALAAVAGTVLAGLLVVGTLSEARTGPVDAQAGGAAAGPAGKPPGPDDGAPEAGPDATPRAPAPPRAVATAAAPAGAELRLRVLRGRSWVQVADARGWEVYSGVLEPGTVRDFSDPDLLQVTLGNAGAVEVVCGRRDAPPGREGQVRRFACRPHGLGPL